MVQEEAKEENEITLDLDEKAVKSKPTLEFILPIVPQSHFYPLHYTNFEIDVNITKQALFSFSLSKFRNEALYEMFPLSASLVLLVGSWMFDYYMSCIVTDPYKHQG